MGRVDGREVEELKVWQESKTLAVMVHRATAAPAWKSRSLANQIERSSSSCMSNVSEGFVKLHPKELRQGFKHCIGSANQTQNHMHLALALGSRSSETFRTSYDPCTLC